MAPGSLRRSTPRPLAAALASLVAIAACRASSPAAPEPPPLAPPAASGPALASTPAASAPAASADPGGLRPFTAGLLSDDAAAQHPERAWLKQLASVRLHPGDPDPFPDAQDSFIGVQRVVVVEQRDRRLRFVIEQAELRVLLWAGLEAFELTTIRSTRVALKPGVYPQGPAGMEGRDELGVWLSPGWQGTPVSRRDGWREIKISDHPFEAEGWLDESLLGVVFTPAEPHKIRAHGRVIEGAHLLASPGGARIGLIARDPGRAPEFIPWFEEGGPAPAGYHHVQFIGHRLVARGLVASFLYRPPEPHVGYGRSGPHSVSYGRHAKKPEPTLAIEPATDLFDEGGDVVGRTRQRVLVSERMGRRVASGRRQVEVFLREVGVVRLWVDEGKVQDHKPPPAVSASASARASASAGAPAR